MNREQLANIVAMANQNLQHMDGTTHPVTRIISNFDLVFGVWQDFKEPYGVGISIIKGARRLLAIEESGKHRFLSGQTLPMAMPTKWSAIKCLNAEHAEAARRVLGDDSTIMESFVYALKSEDGKIKIGSSGNPKTRRQNLQTGSPFRLALFHIEPCAPSIAKGAERRAQRMLSTHKFDGEWFTCATDQAIDAVRRAVEAERNCQISKTSASSGHHRRRR